MREEDAKATVEATLSRLQMADTLVGGASATLARRELRAPADRRALPSIAFDDSESASDDSDLVSRGELGRGGMAVVHRAEQRSLGRDVAVKTTSAGGGARALVREARVMGGLEHPNIVPVHALGMSPHGAPLLIMKRVEGLSWAALLRDPDHESWRTLLAGHGDRLRAHVEILAHVCRALAFAHDRGVVHRDVKAANVMIGRFGEVYLLDWGIALRLAERGEEPPGIVGTPGYVAPEMVRGEPLLVDTRTDVYLLGATLYEVLTGRMPHEAPTAMGALVRSLAHEPEPIPEHAPRELAALAMRAMARDPGARLQSVEAFREGLARFLASHEADLVATEGRAAIGRADALGRAEGYVSPDAFRALVEARFALTSALRTRPDDAGVRAALESCLERLVERELALRSADGASAALAEMRDPSAELVARVERLQRSSRAERDAAAELQNVRKDADSSAALRAMLGAVVGGLLIVLGVHAWEGPAPDRSPTHVVQVWIGSLATWGFMTLGGRSVLLATAFTRRVTSFFTLLLLTAASSALLQSLLGRSIAEAATVVFVAMAGVCSVGAVTLLPELGLCALGFLAGGVASHLDPEHVRVAQACAFTANAGFFGWGLWNHARRSRVESLAAHRVAPGS